MVATVNEMGLLFVMMPTECVLLTPRCWWATLTT